jgi:hypothetical protein
MIKRNPLRIKSAPIHGQAKLPPHRLKQAIKDDEEFNKMMAKAMKGFKTR